MRRIFVVLGVWIVVMCFAVLDATAAPYRVWSTYFGGEGTATGIGSNDTSGVNFPVDVGSIGSDDIVEDGAYSVAVNPVTGDSFISGYTKSTAGIAQGGHQNALAGNRDAYLAKIGPNGATQWATYYGGTGGTGSDEDLDTGFQVVVNTANGDSYLVGSTNSTSGIATAGAFKTALSGSKDAFIAKFNTSGARQWATYFGGAAVVGSDEELATAAAVNSVTGDLYVVGYTGATSGIASAGGHQTTIGGSTDGWLAKFDASGNRLWSTYLGGPGKDYAKGVAVSTVSGDVYVAGTASSSTGVASAGAHQTALQGTQDAFVAKFNASGVRQWATYYGGGGTGTDDWDVAAGIAVDPNTQDVYLAGNTSSSTGIATGGAHQGTYNGNRKTFLTKLNSSGVRQWGTYYGGVGSDDPDFAAGVAVDASTGNVYLAGSTKSQSGIATPDGSQSVSGGGMDGFVAKFNSSGTRQWGTYYGDAQFDVITGIAVNAGEIRLAGRTQSQLDMATFGAVSGFLQGTGDAFVVRLNETPPNAPPNNAFANATPLTSFGTIVTQSTSAANKEAGEPNHGGAAGGASVWFQWTAPSSMAVALNTRGSKFDTLLGVYTGSSVSALTLVAGNDNFSGSSSKVAFNAVGGTTYRIAADGVSGAAGTLRLNLGPANDEFASRITIPSAGSTAYGSTTGASAESSEPSHAGLPVVNSVWWTWTADRTGVAEINTIGSEIDTVLAVYTGSGFPLVAVRSDVSVGSDTGRVTFSAVSGTTYQIAVAGYGGAQGNVLLQVIAPPLPPANDAFANRVNINNSTGVFEGTTVAATVEAGEPNHAGEISGGSVWWTWTAPATGNFEFHVTGGNQDNTVSVYTGTAVNSLVVAGGTRLSYAAFRANVVAGTVYQIAVDSPYGDPSIFTLLIVPPATVPLNDNFASRITFFGATQSLLANNTLATEESGGPDHDGNAGGKTVWWSWTAPASGLVQFNTFNSTFDTVLAVYSGTAVNALTLIAKNDDFQSSQSGVQFQVVVNTTYQIAVDGYDGESGALLLNTILSPDGGSFGLWVESYPALVGAARDRFADPDNDGLTNIEEMVFGLNPTLAGNDPNFANRPVVTSTGSALRIQYTINPAYVGVSYPGRAPVTVIGQTTTALDFGIWTSVAPIGLGGNNYKVEVPIGTDVKRFLRLGITDPNAP